MGDYFQHWLNLGEWLKAKGAKVLPIFNVNWFRTDDQGHFIWPGFGNNMRVLKWMLDRIEGKAQGGTEHVLGTSPKYTDLRWEGLDFSEADFEKVIAIKPEEVRAEFNTTTNSSSAWASACPPPCVKRARHWKSGWTRKPEVSGHYLPEGLKT